MIFITTGTQEPFDRLVEIMDAFALEYEEEIVIQALRGDYLARNVKVKQFFNPKEFDYYFRKASLIISHAGMGTILSALTIQKPILIFPRSAILGEHRNEHQLATAIKLTELGYVHVVKSNEELSFCLQRILNGEVLQPMHKIGKYASISLIDSLKSTIKKL